MSGLFKSPAPDSAFSLGDEEDPSLGEMDHAVTDWKAQPAGKEARGSASLPLGNGSTHIDNGQPPPARASGPDPATQSQTVEQEGGAQADAAQELQVDGKHESPASQGGHAWASSQKSSQGAEDRAAEVSRGATAQQSVRSDSSTPSPVPDHDGHPAPTAASQPSASEEDARIAQVAAQSHRLLAAHTAACSAGVRISCQGPG